MLHLHIQVDFVQGLDVHVVPDMYVVTGYMDSWKLCNYSQTMYHYETTSGVADWLNTVYLYYFSKFKCSPSNSITVCCANGGTCVTDGRNCVCPPGYTGRNCAEELCKLS